MHEDFMFSQCTLILRAQSQTQSNMDRTFYQDNLDDDRSQNLPF